ncbi:glutamate racemase [Buchnera aphidicola]|uniref:glutamate racemase n=1 Tax=Buchnera aphidicola TaxID=9 RepID=UPI003BEECE1A
MLINQLNNKFYTILLLDSGIGGFSILDNIKKYLPKIRYIYMLDNQAFPYGNKTELFLIQRSIKIVKKINQKYTIHLILIACNTLSTVALSTLKKTINIPIIGIFPNIPLAATITNNYIIGLIATSATINNINTKKIISKYSQICNIHIISTNKLANISEQKIRGEYISITQIKKIFQPWMILPVKPDTIVLGCTHFSFLKKEIKIIFNKNTIFIDSNNCFIHQINHIFKLKNYNNIIKNNIFLYSKKNEKLKKLFFYLKKYNFNMIKKISF